MKRWVHIAGGVAAVPLAAFAYYAIAPYFISIEKDEAVPVAATVDMSDAVPVVDTLAHPASGTVRVVVADGRTFLRYENYKTLNGPDLYVYLAKDLDAKEFVNLGPIKATEGNVNYEVPDGVNLADYPYVLTWCKAFGVLFNSARISP